MQWSASLWLAAPCCLPIAVQTSLLAATPLYLAFYSWIPVLYIRKLTTLKIPSCFALQMGTGDVSLEAGGVLIPPEAALQGLAGWHRLTALAGTAAFP